MARGATLLDHQVAKLPAMLIFMARFAMDGGKAKHSSPVGALHVALLAWRCCVRSRQSKPRCRVRCKREGGRLEPRGRMARGTVTIVLPGKIPPMIVSVTITTLIVCQLHGPPLLFACPGFVAFFTRNSNVLSGKTERCQIMVKLADFACGLPIFLGMARGASLFAYKIVAMWGKMARRAIGIRLCRKENRSAFLLQFKIAVAFAAHNCGMFANEFEFGSCMIK
jgi:hypothetical protein